MTVAMSQMLSDNIWDITLRVSYSKGAFNQEMSLPREFSIVQERASVVEETFGKARNSCRILVRPQDFLKNFLSRNLFLPRLLWAGNFVP